MIQLNQWGKECYKTISELKEREQLDILLRFGFRRLALAAKREYQTFLKSLSARLNELDEQIHIGTDEEIKAFQERNYIGQALEEELKSIIVQVESANDLEQLKLTVNQKVHFLNEKFDSYRQSDQTQFEQSQNQIQRLKQRLHLMEQESIELR
ncbi:MAG: hypothetical protein ACI9QV_000414 [Methylophagaceae bacterium]|jgi:uncharacterized protein YecA (UPF0149 family)